MVRFPNIADAVVRRFSALEPLPQPRYIRLRHPLFLMHGFGVLGSLRRGGHLHAEAMHLRSHGVIAFAPNVAPYNTVRIRTELWKEHIEEVLEQTGAEKLNLVAHSMGGLDARYLISEMGMHEVVASLVTVATPHHGSSVATVLLEQPELIRRLVASMCDWMGSHALEACASDFATAVEELTPEAVEKSFNPLVRDHPDVRYWSYAGRAGQGTDVPINPFLLALNLALHAREGINDGFVSVDSARWGTFVRTYDADHARSVGVNVTRSGAFHSSDFYREIVEMLSAEGL